MRGTLVELAVGEGAMVSEGSVLCIIEAMKMENEVRAPHHGVVSGIVVRPGDSVAAGTTIMQVILKGPASPAQH
jgi:biotin carboxyl carrier protein